VAPSANQDALTVTFRHHQTWSNTTVEIGPIELRDDYWDLRIDPYDGHVVLRSPHRPIHHRKAPTAFDQAEDRLHAIAAGPIPP
jgi:hypothetical protein